MAENFKYSFKAPAQAELPLLVHNAGFQKCTPGYRWGPGVRDHYLLHYVVSGAGCYEAGGAAYLLGPGDAFLVRPEETICYHADRDDPWEYYWVGFSGSGAALLLAQTAFFHPSPVIHPAAGERLRQGILEVYRARGTDYSSAVRMAGYLQASLGLLMENRPPSGRKALCDYARQGANYIQRNYAQPIRVEEIARKVGVSRSCLYRAFQAEFGCSPSDYLTRYRLQRARQLLRHSALPVGAIAVSVGFEDSYYFSRVFRNQYGLSPTGYRKGGGENKGGEK